MPDNAWLIAVPTGNPLVVNCTSRMLEPVPTNFPWYATVTPVIVAPAGTVRLMFPANSGVESWLLDKATEATDAPVKKTLLGFVQVCPEPTFTPVVGAVGPAISAVPTFAEAYAVGLNMFPGLLHVVLVAMLPRFGPANKPVVETAVAVRLNNGPSSGWFTKAVNVVMVALSTITSIPFKYDCPPKNPPRIKPSLTVGSGPM